jgi:hypothetical protein
MARLPKRWAMGAAAVLLAGACTRPKPAPAERTEPWAAPPSASSNRSALLRLSIAERSETSFVLTAKEGRVEGSFRVARGELAADLHDLGRTRGTVRVDLASVMVQGAPSGGEDRMAAETAQNWLGVGASVPEAEREKHRWARFSIDQVENLSVRTPHQGKRPPRAPPVSAAGAQSVTGAEADETRTVDLDARGRLLLHGYEVELRVPVSLCFHYQGPPKAGQGPTRVDITTRTAVTVSLDAHDIKPRDPAGNLLPRDLRLLGTRIGREASVSARLTAYPAP